MTRSHETTVRSYYEHVDAEEYEELVDLFADDVSYHRPGQEPIEGREALEQFYHDGRPLSDGEHEVHDVVVGDDTVAVRGSFSGVQDGERVAFGFADIHRFDGDGAIVERWTYTDRDTV